MVLIRDTCFPKIRPAFGIFLSKQVCFILLSQSYSRTIAFHPVAFIQGASAAVVGSISPEPAQC